MTTNLLKRSLPILLAFAVVTAVVHYYVIYDTDLGQLIKNDWWTIHLLLGPLTVIGFLFFAIRMNRSGYPEGFGRGFLLYTVIKMTVILAFLFPWLIQRDEQATEFCMHFFAVFFPYLLIETILLVRFLNQPFGEKSENDENQA